MTRKVFIDKIDEGTTISLLAQRYGKYPDAKITIMKDFGSFGQLCVQYTRLETAKERDEQRRTRR